MNHSLITIYIITYNEQTILPYTIAHYRKAFPECNIIIYDNMSTDNTRKIANENDCIVIQFDTNEQVREDILIKIRNNCWKTCETPWALVCDADEHVQITQKQLINEDAGEATIIRTVGWDAIGMHEENISFHAMTYGVYSPGYGKYYCFNVKALEEINYEPGAHKACPIGNIKYSENVYKAFHYKWLSLSYVVEKHKHLSSRMSKQNILNKWSFHYNYSKRKLRIIWNDLKHRAILIK
jgi:Glycosyl transferase family 2